MIVDRKEKDCAQEDRDNRERDNSAMILRFQEVHGKQRDHDDDQWRLAQ